MSKQKQSPNLPAEKNPQINLNQDKPQAQELFHHTAKNIDSSVRPIIEFVQNKIATDFLKLHNQYLLEGFKRKTQCYEKFIDPKILVTEQKLNKNQKQKNLSPQNQNSQQTKIKPSTQKVLQYYDCFEAQINLANQRYQKIYKKSQDNKQRLIGCIERCSGHSKESNEQFQKCAHGCKTSYTQIMTKLYNNFYNKFLSKG